MGAVESMEILNHNEQEFNDSSVLCGEIKESRVITNIEEQDLIAFDISTVINTRKNRSSVRRHVMLLAKELERRLLVRLESGESVEEVLKNIPKEIIPLLHLDPYVYSGKDIDEISESSSTPSKRNSLQSMCSTISDCSLTTTTSSRVSFKLDDSFQ